MSDVQQLYNYHSSNHILDQQFNKDTMNILRSNNTPLIHIMLQSSGLPMQTVNLLCTAFALIQTGLNIHQRIGNYTNYETSDMQLKVLAGDFYSAKYYKVLADANLIKDIQLFAKSIQQMNEAKMDRHFAKLNIVDSNTYIMWLEQIHTSLACNLVEEYALEKHLWHEICLNVFLAQALINEQKNVLHSYTGIISFKLLLLYEAMKPTTYEQFISDITSSDQLEKLYMKFNLDQSVNLYINDYLNVALEQVGHLQTKYLKDEIRKYIQVIQTENKL
jgi:hypothetical protein